MHEPGPLITTASHDQAQLLDEHYMARVFQRELSALADDPIQVKHCKAKVVMSKQTVGKDIVHIHYWLRIASGGALREYRIVGPCFSYSCKAR